MILTAHQPVYLPWLGLFHKIALSDMFCIFDDVQYLKKDWNSLVKLNDYILFYLLKEIGISVKICRASDEKFEGVKSDIVLDMCKKLCADVYIFGALGRDYAEMDKFEQAGIKIYFQDYHHPEYLQLYGKFVPYVSVIDLLFNCGDNSLDILMSGNKRKKDIGCNVL